MYSSAKHAILAQVYRGLKTLFPARPTLGVSHPRLYFRRLYVGLEARQTFAPFVLIYLCWHKIPTNHLNPNHTKEKHNKLLVSIRAF